MEVRAYNSSGTNTCVGMYVPRGLTYGDGVRVFEREGVRWGEDWNSNCSGGGGSRRRRWDKTYHMFHR